MTPTVTILTPTTKDREEFNVRIWQISEAQDYPNIVEHLFDPSDKPLGEKRNDLCEKAKGEILVHFDSDDIYSPDWVSKSVEHLLSKKAHVTGLKEGYFYNPYQRKAWVCRTSNQYPLGATLVYYRSIWTTHKFPNIRRGEDTAWLEKIKNVKTHDYSDGFIATIHGYNTASHEALNRMSPIDPLIPENIINLSYNTV